MFDFKRPEVVFQCHLAIPERGRCEECVIEKPSALAFADAKNAKAWLQLHLLWSVCLLARGRFEEEAFLPVALPVAPPALDMGDAEVCVDPARCHWELLPSSGHHILDWKVTASPAWAETGTEIKKSRITPVIVCEHAVVPSRHGV